MTEKHFKNSIHKRDDENYDPKIIIYIQSRIRGYLAWLKITRQKRDENIFVRFYIKMQFNICRITV